ncbi:trk system potassium uptake protein TrkA [Lachnotalea glycerini]|uniref:Trk system potassium uptake protein TrkA n=1 Tax=Lachnotalea glycerini TaxID=1763509 RepID=A0A318EML4_9FIRM|nr:Trk system potassium transporter TrkA [Lachnotalea glycerini]PXV91145.1 trk system potassium uptake protein TrkA [Lachnotalea glycerini]
MKIIIIGCGKVGASLAELLDEEGHEITLIDNKASAIRNITDTLDVLGVVGNGACHSIQITAGIETADLLIAVTNSDELNLLCCMMAKKASDCHTIARVRNPQYNSEISFIKEGMGLSMIINPEEETATDIARLIRLPSAIKIDVFAKGRVELLQLKLPKDSILHNMMIKDIQIKLRCNILVCAVERADEIFIPSGNFTLQANDKISIVATPKNAIEFFHKIGITTTPIKNVMLVGGGNISVYLAQKFIDMGVTVKIIEQNIERCEQLSETLPKALVIHANASEYNVLLEEGILEVDAFASLTNMDEENILLSLYAQKKTHAKVFTKISRLLYDEITNEMEIGTIIKPKLITADRIAQHVRVMQNPKGNNVETLYKIVGNKVEALEFRIRDNSKLIGIPLSDLPIKENILVSCVNRKNHIIIPDGQVSLQSGDSVIIVTTNTRLNDLNDILI